MKKNEPHVPRESKFEYKFVARCTFWFKNKKATIPIITRTNFN